MNVKKELDRVLFLISWWLCTFKSQNAIFFDDNKVVEMMALKMIKEIYDYQLKNLNYEKNNYPGIDWRIKQIKQVSKSCSG